MEQQLFLSCLSLFVNKNDYVNTDANNTEETKWPF